MYVLYAEDKHMLHEQTRIFQRHMEPALAALEEHANIETLGDIYPDVVEYLQVCHWGFRRLEYSFVLETLLSHLKPGDLYLDAGCGVTPLVHVLAQRQIECYGCDYSSRVIRGLQQVDTQATFGTHVEFSCENLAALSYPDQMFDAISCVSVLEHIPAPHDQTALHQLMRVLKPEGFLILTVDFEPSTAAANSSRIGYYIRRTAGLLGKGQLLEIYHGFRRRLSAIQVVQNGAARQPRVANECFRIEHLQQDLLPLFADYEHPSKMAFSPDLTAYGPDAADRFWTVGDPGREPQGRAVLPVAWIIRKPSHNGSH